MSELSADLVECRALVAGRIAERNKAALRVINTLRKGNRGEASVRMSVVSAEMAEAKHCFDCPDEMLEHEDWFIGQAQKYKKAMAKPPAKGKSGISHMRSALIKIERDIREGAE